VVKGAMSAFNFNTLDNGLPAMLNTITLTFTFTFIHSCSVTLSKINSKIFFSLVSDPTIADDKYLLQHALWGSKPTGPQYT
jgi:hypothetical protein